MTHRAWTWSSANFRRAVMRSSTRGAGWNAADEDEDEEEDDTSTATQLRKTKTTTSRKKKTTTTRTKEEAADAKPEGKS